MITPTSGSSRARSKASIISITVSGRKALRTSGRSIVILAMPAFSAVDFSLRMSSYSAAAFQLVTAAQTTVSRVYDWLARATLARPERTAIEYRDQSLRYHELAARAGSAEPAGSAAALEIEDPLAFAVALHGCLRAGRAAVPIDLRLGEDERAMRRATATRGAEAGVATIMHTSGTTSAPKPVALTFAIWQANALGSAVALGLDPHERWLCVMPLAHVGGLSILIRSAVYATTVVLHDRFDVGAVGEELMSAERRITLVSLVPTMLARLLDGGLANPPTLRWALLGGGPIAPALLERAASAGVPVAPTYGMTEACSQIATFGLPLPGVSVRLDPAGEILVRGAVVAPGALADDGWLHTGDLGAFDDRGRLVIVGRRADTIVSGGENVAPAEVEAVLVEHPEVADAAVFGVADPEWGEAVVASVVLASDGRAVGAEELRAFCRGRLAGFKVPKEIRFVETLPRTASGKLLRRELISTD